MRPHLARVGACTHSALSPSPADVLPPFPPRLPLPVFGADDFELDGPLLTILSLQRNWSALMALRTSPLVEWTMSSTASFGGRVDAVGHASPTVRVTALVRKVGAIGLKLGEGRVLSDVRSFRDGIALQRSRR